MSYCSYCGQAITKVSNSQDTNTKVHRRSCGQFNAQVTKALACSTRSK